MTGIIVPLYNGPSDISWTQIVTAKQAYPLVPIVAVINPNSGPGASFDQNYVAGIKKLRQVGIIVLGYDHTSYAARPLSAVESDINKYRNWYNIQGYFFDEMSTSTFASTALYYQKIANYVGAHLTIGNPGTRPESGLFGIFSTLCIYENPGIPDVSLLTPRGNCYIAYGVPSLVSSVVLNTATFVRYLFVTNLGGQNPYSGLPSYFMQEVALLSP